MASPSKILVFCLISFLSGVFVFSFLKLPLFLVWEVIILGILYSLFFFKKKKVLLFGLCMILFGSGMLRVYFSSENSFSFEPLSFLKNRFEKVIEENLSPPQSFLLSALVLGNKREISAEWKEKLNRSGLRHIVAISGMHIVILSSFLLWLGLALGLHKYRAIYLSLLLIWLFIFMIGSPVSALRAGIMGSLMLLCERWGRKSSSLRALLYAGFVMILFNPLLLKESVGFQLSFLASFGIISLSPLIKRFLKKVLKKGSLAELLSLNFSAQIMTLPLLIYYFGQFSLVSAFSNLLVVPFLPYLMMIGFCFVVFGSFLSFLFLFPVWLLLSYVVKIADFFSGLSFSVLQLNIHWFWVFAIYALILVFVWRIKKRQTVLPYYHVN